MDGRILYDLRDYLNDRTLPGKPYQVGPGIGWSVILPKQDYAADLKAVLGDSRLRTMVGTILPSGSRVIKTSRQPYGQDEPRAGAFREAELYFSVFARSLKSVAFDGDILAIEDLLQELVGDFSNKDSPSANSATLGGLSIMSLPPDFTVMEFTGTVSYHTLSKTEAASRLRQIQLGGPLVRLTKNFPS